MTATGAALAQLDSLLAEYNNFRQRLNAAQQNTDAARLTYRLQAAIERLSEPTGPYGRDMERFRRLQFRTPTAKLISVASIAAALRDDIRDGYMSSVVELTHADTYADYLSMAAGLHAEGYKDAAAVIGGTSLEVHLKTLATKHGISLQAANGGDKKASVINDDLKKAAVYNALEHKQVTAWLAIRNSAAHGDYGDYTAEDVKALIAGVGNFAVKYPA